ncbi:hypothetical protein P5U49_000206 [Neisseria gonorrhoeae]
MALYKKSYSDYRVLDFDKISPEIKNRGCDGICGEFVQRKVGVKGVFFHCTKCSANIPEAPDGTPATPIGVCRICRSYIYQDVARTGVVWHSCSQFSKHKNKRGR